MFDNTNTIHQLRKFYCFISKTRTFFLLFSSYISVAMLGDDKSGGVDEKADYVNNFSNFLFFSLFSSLFSSFISVAMLGDNKSGGVDEKAEYMNKFVRGR